MVLHMKEMNFTDSLSNAIDPEQTIKSACLALCDDIDGSSQRNKKVAGL